MRAPPGSCTHSSDSLFFFSSRRPHTRWPRDWSSYVCSSDLEYGLSIWDLDRKFITGGLGGKDILPLREILSILRDTYTRKIGIEYMHISSPQERNWLQERIEPVRCEEPLSHATKVRILKKLNAAEAFERFLHTKYIGHKRFSLEGAESVKIGRAHV